MVYNSIDDRNNELLKNKDYDTLISENINMVRFVLCKIRINNKDDYDDYFQIGCMALYIAALYYNESKNVKFNTYALNAIKNNILQAVYRKNKKENELPITQRYTYDENGEELDILDFVDSKVRVEYSILKEELYKCIYEIIDTKLSHNQKIIMRLKLENFTTNEIQNMFSYSKSYINDTYHKAMDKIKIELEKREFNSDYLSKL